MHSIKIDGITVHFNGDYSGNVLLTVPKEKVEDGLAGTALVEIEFEVLKKLILGYFQHKMIETVEAMDYQELEDKVNLLFL